MGDEALAVRPDFYGSDVVCVFTFRVSSWVVVNGSANRILKTQEDAPGGFPQGLIVGSTGGAWAVRLCEPDWPGLLPPPHRTVRAVFPHTAHRRSSPLAFGYPRHARCGRGATMIPLRSIRPKRSGDWKAKTDQP